MNDPLAAQADDLLTSGNAEVPPPTSTSVAGSPPIVTAVPVSSDAPPGYELLGVVGKGGMGVVHMARDVTLDRLVAIKLLRPSHAHDRLAASRFLSEARISARLQHPGIPAVHEVGALADGRPFLAMKLVRGQTLAELLQEKGPGAGRWLGVFEAVCQAVGYAHSQNIIHRDLKPSNVMVGAFGEVQVMDWGLAKGVTTEARPPRQADEDSLATQAREAGWADAAETDQTEAGSVLGTPAFMAPEQAIGAIDQLDRRSDVFGLGAILCALLTGKPPFVAADAESTRQLAARAKLDDAFTRLDGCGAEPDLIAITKRCLAAEKDARPADAAELAVSIATLRQQAEERARHAELDSARGQVQAQEQRKRRRLALAATGALVAALTAGVVGTTLGLIRAEGARGEEAKQRAEADEKRIEAEKASVAAEKASKEAEANRRQAEGARDKARRRHRLALEAFNQMVFGLQNKLEDRAGTQEFRRELLENARAGLRKLLADSERQGSLDSTLVWSHFRMGDLELNLGDTTAALAEFQAGNDLARGLADAAPRSAQALRDLAAGNDRLGDLAMRTGDPKRALGHYREALQARRRLADVDPKSTQAERDLSASHIKLGDVAMRESNPKEAREHYQKALDVRRRLADAAPKDAKAQLDLAVSSNKAGDAAGALGDEKSARDHYEQGLKASLFLAGVNPKGVRAQRDLSISHERLGGVALKTGDLKGASDHHQKSLAIRQLLAEADPSNADAHVDLFVSYLNLGSVEKKKHDFAGASAWFAKARAALLPWPEKKRLAGRFKNGVALADHELAFCKDAQKAVADLEFVLAQKSEKVPGLLELRARALIRYNKIDEAAKTAERWAAWAERQDKARDEQRYNAACAFALCAAAGAAKEKGGLIDKALALLAKARDAGYFADPRRLAHFKEDADFASVRDHPAFAKFAKELEKK